MTTIITKCRFPIRRTRGGPYPRHKNKTFVIIDDVLKKRHRHMVDLTTKELCKKEGGKKGRKRKKDIDKKKEEKIFILKFLSLIYSDVMNCYLSFKFFYFCF